VILDEIDKTDADLERMNDALEGEQLVDVNKAGQSATFKSRVGLLATGNPTESRFDKQASVADQIGIDQSLLSRFDGIITMEDSPSSEKDARIAEAQGMTYVEAQEYDSGDRDEFDHLERVVSPAVGRAWVAYARERVNPTLSEHHVEMIRDWYADEVRTMNKNFDAVGDGDMPVPASARSVMDTIRFAVAFARANLRESVDESDVERAKELTHTLIGQTFDADTNRFQGERTKGASQDDRIDGLKRIIDEYDDDADGADIDNILTAAQDQLSMSVTKTESYLDTLKSKGEVIDAGGGMYRLTDSMN